MRGSYGLLKSAKPAERQLPLLLDSSERQHHDQRRCDGEDQWLDRLGCIASLQSSNAGL